MINKKFKKVFKKIDKDDLEGTLENTKFSITDLRIVTEHV